MKLLTKRNLAQQFGAMIITFLFFVVQVFAQTDGKIVEREAYVFSAVFVEGIIKAKNPPKNRFLKIRKSGESLI